MDKALFKEYEQWCVKENKDPLSHQTISEFKNFKENEKQKENEDSKLAKLEEKVKKQEELFLKMCEYVGVKTKYNAKAMFNTIEKVTNSIVLAAVALNKQVELNKAVDKVMGGE